MVDASGWPELFQELLSRSEEHCRAAWGQHADGVGAMGIDGPAWPASSSSTPLGLSDHPALRMPKYQP